jgi:hypothetical protein
MLKQVQHDGGVVLGWAITRKKWCLGTDSNRRHADFQSAALPTELPRPTKEARAS